MNGDGNHGAGDPLAGTMPHLDGRHGRCHNSFRLRLVLPGPAPRCPAGDRGAGSSAPRTARSTVPGGDSDLTVVTPNARFDDARAESGCTRTGNAALAGWVPGVTSGGYGGGRHLLPHRRVRVTAAVHGVPGTGRGAVGSHIAPVARVHLTPAPKGAVTAAPVPWLQTVGRGDVIGACRARPPAPATPAGLRVPVRGYGPAIGHRSGKDVRGHLTAGRPLVHVAATQHATAAGITAAASGTAHRPQRFRIFTDVHHRPRRPPPGGKEAPTLRRFARQVPKARSRGDVACRDQHLVADATRLCTGSRECMRRPPCVNTPSHPTVPSKNSGR